MNRVPFLVAAAVAVLLAPLSGCSSSDESELLDPGGKPAGLRQRTDLRAELGRADVDPIGVARDGARTLIFDLELGIHELGQGPLMAQMPDPGVEVRLPFTDLAHLGGDRFAVTAIGDGFLLDTAADTMQLHFCYEPGFQPWGEQEQRTDAVTYDAATGTIYAQPQTIQLADETRTASSIGVYDGPTGTLLAWHELPVEFTAGGLAVGRAGLLLGSGKQIYNYDLTGAGGLTEVGDLGRFGVRAISGLAIDATSLFVTDAETDQVLELDRALLGL